MKFLRRPISSLETKKKRGLINPRRKRSIFDKYVLVGSQYIPIDQYRASHGYPSIKKVKRVRKQRQRNPVHKPVVIYDKLLEISAVKKHGKFKGESFKHNFRKDTDAVVLGLKDGSLKIVSKAGKPLWKKFNY